MSVRSAIHDWWPIAAFLFVRAPDASSTHEQRRSERKACVRPPAVRRGHIPGCVLPRGDLLGCARGTETRQRPLFRRLLRMHRVVRTGPAIAAAALSLLPFIVPGLGPLGSLGMVVLAADLCIQRAHQQKMAAIPV